jgi:SAM-dependent methyltransferase
MCPTCGAGADLFLAASFDPARVNAASYASRKAPELMSHRFLACRACATVYASPAPSAVTLASAYHAASYDSAEEAGLAAETYGPVLAPHLVTLPKGDALEIGSGTGIFLQVLQRAGFQRVTGIEPSPQAIAAATPAVRGFIREGVFVAEDFAPESFDLVCCFMTLEHVIDPLPLVRGVRRLLRPGGLLALVTHNYQAPLNRLLGRRSPIIDIEHMQIYCPRSLERLLGEAGLASLGVQSFRNRYPLRYWLRLAPLPVAINSTFRRVVAALGLDRTLVGVNVGNVLTVARNTIE